MGKPIQHPRPVPVCFENCEAQSTSSQKTERQNQPLTWSLGSQSGVHLGAWPGTGMGWDLASLPPESLFGEETQ